MTEAANESQTQTAPAEQQVQIGFEKALGMLDPQWRTNMTKDEINRHRHFYHQGIQDLFLLVRISHEQMQQNFQSVLNTVIVTGNEEELAARQREYEEQQAEAAKPVKVGTSKSEAKRVAAQTKATPLKVLPQPPKKVAKKGKK